MAEKIQLPYKIAVPLEGTLSILILLCLSTNPSPVSAAGPSRVPDLEQFINIPESRRELINIRRDIDTITSVIEFLEICQTNNCSDGEIAENISLVARKINQLPQDLKKTVLTKIGLNGNPTQLALQEALLKLRLADLISLLEYIAQKLQNYLPIKSQPLKTTILPPGSPSQFEYAQRIYNPLNDDEYIKNVIPEFEKLLGIRDDRAFKAAAEKLARSDHPAVFHLRSIPGAFDETGSLVMSAERFRSELRNRVTATTSWYIKGLSTVKGAPTYSYLKEWYHKRIINT
jgi:hypothetical protein